MKHQFRIAERAGEAGVINCLSELRSELNVSEFPACVQALRLYAPKVASKVFASGPSGFNSLVWARMPLKRMSLERELQWSACWLGGAASRINRFRAFAESLQETVIEGRIHHAVGELDAFIGSVGWSLWAVELRCFFGPLGRGVDAQKQWTSQLQALVPNSIPGLLLHVFSDRNDETLSYDAFISKCVDGFARYGQLAEWLPSYLLYRSLAFYDDAEVTFSGALSRDITSSLIDYYETLVDLLRTISTDPKLSPLISTAAQVIATLQKSGITDRRLAGISCLLTGDGYEQFLERRSSEAMERVVAILRDQSGRFLIEDAPNLVNEQLRQLQECKELGVVAQKGLSSLSKFGVNAKGLDICSAIGTASSDAVSDLITEQISSVDIALAQFSLAHDDIASFRDDVAKKLLSELSVSHPDSGAKAVYARYASILDGSEYRPSLAKPGNIDLWLARQLIAGTRFEEAKELAHDLRSYGGRWARHATKILLWSHIKSNDIGNAILLSANVVTDNADYIGELPLRSIFEGRDWTWFRGLDPIQVGLVANQVNASFGIPVVGYICKMACRSFAMKGLRDDFPGALEGMAEQERNRAVAFLRDVWVEENLSMNHLLESTDDVRNERMNILQMLLPWDVGNEAFYIDAIKDLTFDETLRQGLRHINETRVFVNEIGISRWAEKELTEDFSRWISLTEATPVEVAPGLARQYAVSPQNEALLEKLGSGRPTEADVQLTSILERLFKRFLTDPVDGLDCYLSLRIRHGSLRGTLFGPLEEQGLLYSSSDFARSQFDRRWRDILDLDEGQRAEVQRLMEAFTARLKEIADDLVNERVQIFSQDKPQGAINSQVNPDFAPRFSVVLRESKLSLALFLYTCYYLFWQAIELGLIELADYIRAEVKEKIRREFDHLVSELRRIDGALPLVTALTALGTATQSHCDTIADWFRLPGKADDEKFKLSVAIEIAKAATKNVHRAFPADVLVEDVRADDPPLGTLGLAVLSDCLFVIFENAWKHSGLGSDIGPIELCAAFDSPTQLLSIRVVSNLSAEVRSKMEGGGLEELKAKYFARSPVEFANREGGSGFAKLAKFSRFVDRTVCQSPLEFGIEGGRWFTSVTIPMFERNGAYEAFQ